MHLFAGSTLPRPRSLSPSSNGPRTPKGPGKNSTDITTAVRAAQSKAEARSVRFNAADSPTGVSPPAKEPSPRRPRSLKPPPASLEPLTALQQKVAVPAGAPALLRLRPHVDDGEPPAWYLFPGVILGVSPDSRRNERLLIDAPTLLEAWA